MPEACTMQMFLPTHRGNAFQKVVIMSTRNYLWLCMLGLMLSGCDLPFCQEGMVVCGEYVYGDLQIYQAGHCEDGVRCTSVQNDKPCQLYQCTQGEYKSLSVNCERGSELIDGVLACTPECRNGEVICATTDSEGKRTTVLSEDGRHGDHFDSACQMYECINGDYVFSSNCPIGSRYQNGKLSCIPQCESLPKYRCKIDENQATIVQICNNNKAEIWDTSTCVNSCKFDLISTYEDDGFKEGTCGECRNDMQHYCLPSSEKLEKISCYNGTESRETVDTCPPNLPTKCETGYVYTSRDIQNCGSCNHACTGMDQCINGVCQPCDADGYMDYQINDKQIRAFCIHNADELKAVHDSLANGQPYPESNADNSYIIVSDINFTDQWTPLGSAESPVDQITFIGLNHAISFEQPILGDQYSGMFGYVKNALFDSIYLKSAQITYPEIPELQMYTKYKHKDISLADLYPAAGGLAGRIEKSVIQNTRIGADVHGISNVGGIAGILDNCEIRNSETSGNLIIENSHITVNENSETCKRQCNNFRDYDYGNLGGLAGQIESSIITDSHSDAQLESRGNQNVGGLVGNAIYGNTIKNSYRIGSIHTMAKRIGGIVASAGTVTKHQTLTIENSYTTGQTDDEIAELKNNCSYNEESKSVECSDILPENLLFYDTTYRTTISAIGGIIGEIAGSAILTGDYVKTDIACETNCGGFIGRVSRLDEFEFSNILNLQPPPTIAQNIVIDSCLDLDVRTDKCYASPSSDVEIKTNIWSGGIVGFISDKSDLTIKHIRANVKINAQKQYINTSEIAGNYIGGLVGYDTDHIELNDIHLDVSAKGGNHIGGMFGQFEGPEIHLKNSSIQMILDAKDEVGGITGKLTTKLNITDTKLGGTIACRDKCGGVLGSFENPGSQNSNDRVSIDGLLIDNLSIGGRNQIGTIAGYNDRHISSNTLHIKELAINGTNQIGGLVGSSTGNVGGKAWIDNVRIEFSGSQIGGLIGYNSGSAGFGDVLIAADLWGSSDQTQYIGGMIGQNKGETSVYEGYINAFINGGKYLGLVVGQQSENKLSLETVSAIGELQAYPNNADYIGSIAGSIDSEPEWIHCIIYPKFNNAAKSANHAGNFAGYIKTISPDTIKSLYYPKNATGMAAKMAGANSAALPSDELIPYTIDANGTLFIQNSNGSNQPLNEALNCRIRLKLPNEDQERCIVLPAYWYINPTMLQPLGDFCIPNDQADAVCHG